MKKTKHNKQAKIALNFVKVCIERIKESHLNNVIEEKSKDVKPKENLEAVSRSQFKRVQLCINIIGILYYFIFLYYFIRNLLII